MNHVMTSPEKQKVFGRLFTFSLNEKNQVMYRAHEPAFTPQIMSHMGHVLGFSYNIIFSGTRPITAGGKRNLGTRMLLKNDYPLLYFSTNVQVEERRIMNKESKKTFAGKEETFVKLWNDAVSPLYDIFPEFKSKKRILHNHKSSIGMMFAPDFF